MWPKVDQLRSRENFHLVHQDVHGLGMVLSNAKKKTKMYVKTNIFRRFCAQRATLVKTFKKIYGWKNCIPQGLLWTRSSTRPWKGIFKTKKCEFKWESTKFGLKKTTLEKSSPFFLPRFVIVHHVVPENNCCDILLRWLGKIGIWKVFFKALESAQTCKDFEKSPKENSTFFDRKVFCENSQLPSVSIESVIKPPANQDELREQHRGDS